MSQSEGDEAVEIGEGELPESKVLDHLGLVAGWWADYVLVAGTVRSSFSVDHTWSVSPAAIAGVRLSHRRPGWSSSGPVRSIRRL